MAKSSLVYILSRGEIINGCDEAKDNLIIG